MPSPKRENDVEDQTDVDLIDPDDPEYQKEGMRSPVVKEDVKMMDQRQRVQKILNSDAFRNELEDLIDAQISSGGPQTPSILALRQLSDLLGSKGGVKGPTARSGVLPINDIRGTEVGCYSKTERIMRCKLASCYRLLDTNGWTHGIFNHISVRIDDEKTGPVFLLNPFGLLYSEITASSLVKINSVGDVLDQGSTTLGVNRAGWNLHASIHNARSDLRCVIHVHTPSVVAISASKHGLLPGLSQESMIIGPITYHSYEGIFVDEGERSRLSDDIGTTSKVLFLRNHGLVVGGGSVEEAYHLLFNTMAAVDVQTRLGTNIDPDDVIQASDEIIQKVVSVTREPVADPNQSIYNPATGYQINRRRWGVGELEYEALMRQLDNAGYRTGYPYKQMDVTVGSSRRPADREDIEIPPASTSNAYLYADEEERSRIMAAHRLMNERARSQHRTEWLNTPNTYHREEVEEKGTDKPRKFTRWVADKNGENTHSGQGTPIRTPNQFAPQGSNPKEFKEQQKKIRGKYYQDMRSAGPQSRLLDGITEQEARKLVEEGRAKMAGDRTVLVGAASMGIIQKEHRENAVVYHNVYSPNPFEKVTDAELSQYHNYVQGKDKPEEEDMPPSSEIVAEYPEEPQPQAEEVVSTPKARSKHSSGSSSGSDGSSTDTFTSPKVELRTEGPKGEAIVTAPQIMLPAEETTIDTVNTDTLRSEASGGGDTTSQDESRASLTKDGDKKKKQQKRGFRMPSFSKKKDKK